MVSRGTGGPDFALGRHQLRWLESELASANALKTPSIVCMHAYPADLRADREAVTRLLTKYQVILVNMGHTHYNELANDGTTLFATTRSTGQVEGGPVGFSLVSLNPGVVRWRFKPLQSPWSFVMISSPADHRLLTERTRLESMVSGEIIVRAQVFGARPLHVCRCRLNESPWTGMHRSPGTGEWALIAQAPAEPFTFTVEAADASGNRDTDQIRVATPGYRTPARAGNGSAADALGAWPKRLLLATPLGANRNGRRW